MSVTVNKMISIGLTIAIIGGGGFLIYRVDKTIKNSNVYAQSTLGSIPNQSQEKDKPEFKQIIRDTQKKVVLIEVENEEESGLGSGFLYNDKGDIITNAHVVEGAKKIRIKTSDTSIYPGKVIGMSIEKDVAVIRVKALAGKEPLKINIDKKAEIGDPVIAFGNPHGLENTVTNGIISGIDRDLTIGETKYRGVYQTSVPIAPGNSGGPLVLQSTGEAIGINSAGGKDGNIGFSIPLSQVMTMVQGWSMHPNEKLASESSSEGEGKLSQRYTKDSLAQDARYLVQYFYDSVNSRDYVNAYAVLGSSMKNGLSYEKFRSGYLNTMNVEVKEISVHSSTSSKAEIIAIIEARESNNGEQHVTMYKVTYMIGLENDSLRILKGKGETMK
ncbi:S1C family serine protease [Aneurinibacillus aneurinilyticus]|uniref:S1C family serine protease n=1 Tax=Aneurinibacillus aneurinilyticus TaxID=1391 RepID=UPI0023F1E970|nr:trypsin-like peptidase domain-containing protein [Aneurinibacillus aneurinilyticus]